MVVLLPWAPIEVVDQAAVGLGNSFETMSCAVAKSMPLLAASKSQFFSKAISLAWARLNVWAERLVAAPNPGGDWGLAGWPKADGRRTVANTTTRAMPSASDALLSS